METNTTAHAVLADDLFAGAGGWDIAAAALGIHARGVENMSQARATRDAAGLSTIHDDVWTFRPRYTARPEGLALHATGLIASPPCQTFSAAGKGAGRKALTVVQQLIPHMGGYTLKQLRRIGTRATGDERTALVLTPLWFALHHPYRWLAWEQVPAVLPVWEACAEALRALGWSVWTGVLNAEQYGVPQTRRRAVLIASRDHEVTPPTPTHSRYYSRTPEKLDAGVPRWVSMAEALQWGLVRRPSYTITSGSQDGHGAGAEWGGAPARAALAAARASGDPLVWLGGNGAGHTGLSPRAAGEPFATITGAGNAVFYVGNREQTPDGAPRFTTEGTEAERAWPDHRPSPTVVGSFHPEIVSAPGYRTTTSRQNQPHSVRVSVSEAGVLQSFPADFPWQGAKGKQYLQCGNAVPPLLAMAVLCAATGQPFIPAATVATDEPAQPALATL